jgi:lysophospholipase L1-like esterase
MFAKLKPSFGDIKIFFFASLVALYFAEGLLRIAFSYPHPLSNYYPFKAAQFATSFNVDQYEFKTQHKYNYSGFRDKDISNKNSGTKRILFVGDSFTEGFGVAENARFSNQAIKNLGPIYEQVNIGQLGTNPNHYLNNLTKFGVALKPDLILMSIFLGNDFQGGKDLPNPNITVNYDLPILSDNSLINFFKLEYIRSLFIYLINGDKKLFYSFGINSKNFWEIYFDQKINKDFWSKLLNVNSDKLDEITKSFNQEILQEIYAGRLQSSIFYEGINKKLGIKDINPYYIDSDYLNTFKYIRESKRISEENRINFLILIIPDINQVHPVEFQEVFKRDFEIESIPSRFKQIESIRNRLKLDLLKNNINYIDTTEHLKKSPQLTYYLYDNHMNEVGHSILGKLIAKKLQEIYGN